MAIVHHAFRLLEKKPLTSDVFELTFSSSTAPAPKPGQYILFQLPSGLKRAYSISYASGDQFKFIIKRMPFEASGSAEICDFPMGTEVPGMGPL